MAKIFKLKIICHRCRWYRWCTLTCEYLREFSKKFETVLLEYSGSGGKLIHQKTRSKKSPDTVPLKALHWPYIGYGWKCISGKVFIKEWSRKFSANYACARFWKAFKGTVHFNFKRWDVELFIFLLIFDLCPKNTILGCSYLIRTHVNIYYKSSDVIISIDKGNFY